MRKVTRGIINGLAEARTVRTKVQPVLRFGSEFVGNGISLFNGFANAKVPELFDFSGLQRWLNRIGSIFIMSIVIVQLLHMQKNFFALILHDNGEKVRAINVDRQLISEANW